MNQVVIILNEDGSFDNALSDSEVNLVILKRGKDDAKIDAAETTYEPIDE